jgi:hypothetical protein
MTCDHNGGRDARAPRVMSLQLPNCVSTWNVPRTVWIAGYLGREQKKAAPWFSSASTHTLPPCR